MRRRSKRIPPITRANRTGKRSPTHGPRGQCTHARVDPERRRRTLVTIKTYPTQFEADAARIALEAAGIPCVVVGVGVSMEGGIGGVQLQVPPGRVDAALEILQES